MAAEMDTPVPVVIGVEKQRLLVFKYEIICKALLLKLKGGRAW